MSLNMTCVRDALEDVEYRQQMVHSLLKAYYTSTHPNYPWESHTESKLLQTFFCNIVESFSDTNEFAERLQARHAFYTQPSSIRMMFYAVLHDDLPTFKTCIFQYPEVLRALHNTENPFGDAIVTTLSPEDDRQHLSSIKFVTANPTWDKSPFWLDISSFELAAGHIDQAYLLDTFQFVALANRVVQDDTARGFCKPLKIVEFCGIDTAFDRVD